MSSINARAQSDIFNFLTKAKADRQKITGLVITAIGERLVNLSPVGDPSNWVEKDYHKHYRPGLFKNNWQLGIDQIPENGATKGEAIDLPNPSGSGSLARLKKIGRWPVGHQYFFVNNLPYSRALEEGWSGQAPNGMVGITELEFPQMVRDAAAIVKGGL